MRSRLAPFVLTTAALAAAVLLGFAAHADPSASPTTTAPSVVLVPVPAPPATHLLFSR